VLETVDSFLKFVNEDRFPKLKDFELKMHWAFGNTYPFFKFKTCESVVLKPKSFYWK